MPGYAGWKILYKEELFQLAQEGYDTEKALKFDELTGRKLPFPDEKDTVVDMEEEKFWEKAYEKLWKLYGSDLRKDYPYEEPETLEEIMQKSIQTPEMPKLKSESYRSRIEGAVYGRCAGVVLGKPLEMGFDRKKIKEYLESVGQYPLSDYVAEYSEKLDVRLREDCIPSTKGNIKYVQPDDDIHYTILSILLAENYGLEFDRNDIGKLWTENIPYRWFWCASRQAYYHYVNIEERLDKKERLEEIPVKLNPWRECIDGQIRCDLWGYLFPGKPEKAAEVAYKDCSFSLTKNGVYGGMFVAGCISAALTERPDINRILDGGLSVIPKKSRLAEAVRKVRSRYTEKNKDWIKVCNEIYEEYGELPFAATINNLAMVTLALLHGELDYGKTITTAVMCGIDTDCNAGTAGSIVGAAKGMGNIDKKWIKPLNNTIKSAVASFGEGSISGLVDRILILHERDKNR